MAIVLGSYTFDEKLVAVTERVEEVGGRDGRVIELSGVTPHCASVAAAESQLDAIAGAASSDTEVALSIRAGRRLWVRRVDFSREVARGARTGHFSLKLAAASPWEEGTDEVTETWNVSSSGETHSISTAGNAAAPLHVTLTAAGELVRPGVSDGEREIVYPGVVTAGSVIVFNGQSGVITLDGQDVTPHGEGAFPMVSPGGTDVVYNDDAGSTHQAVVVAAWRDRWW